MSAAHLISKSARLDRVVRIGVLLLIASSLLAGCGKAAGETPPTATFTPLQPQYPTTLAVIQEGEAVDKALAACSHTGLEPQVAPRNLQAELTTLGAARQRLRMEAPLEGDQPEIAVWLVSMDGSWLLYEPAPELGPTPTPQLLNHCSVILDSRDGGLLALSSELPQ